VSSVSIIPDRRRSPYAELSQFFAAARSEQAGLRDVCAPPSVLTMRPADEEMFTMTVALRLHRGPNRLDEQERRSEVHFERLAPLVGGERRRVDRAMAALLTRMSRDRKRSSAADDLFRHARR
jgi:hypothetical protein